MMPAPLSFGLAGADDTWPWQEVLFERFGLLTVTATDATKTRQNEIALGFTHSHMYWYLWRVDRTYAEAIVIASVGVDGEKPVVCCFDTGAAVTRDSSGNLYVESTAGLSGPSQVQKSTIDWNAVEHELGLWVDAAYSDGIRRFIDGAPPNSSHCDVAPGPAADSRWFAWEARLARGLTSASSIEIERLFNIQDNFDSLKNWLRASVGRYPGPELAALTATISTHGFTADPYASARDHLDHLAGQYDAT